MNDVNSRGAMRPLKLSFLMLGVWCLLVLAFAGQLVFIGGLSWPEAAALAFRDWVPWVLLAPLTAWLAFRFPFDRENLAWSIPIHVVACMLALLFCDLVLRSLPRRQTPPAELPAHLRQAAPPRPLPGAGRRSPVPPPLERPLPPPSPAAHLLLVDIFARRAQFNLPIYWIIVALVQAVRYYTRSEERERHAAELEARLAEAKLDSLRMQLHPHFLFNTLNAISTLVHKDPNAADEMLANLSELLRATLSLSEQQEIPLRQELDIAEKYLQIQKVRLGERLQVQREIDASTLDALVPTMILQPLVENAVRHGVEPHRGTGRVEIRVGREGALLMLRVDDQVEPPETTGEVEPAAPKETAEAAPGMDRLKSALQQRNGLGLANTRARLNLLYGTRARLVTRDGTRGGFSVSLELPFHSGGEPR